MSYKNFAVTLLMALPAIVFSQSNSISGFGETGAKQELE